MAKKRYFSLIEILVAISLIAILLAIGEETYSYMRKEAREAKTKALVKKLELAMISYKNETGYYIPQGQDGYVPFEIAPNDTTFIKHIDFTKIKNSGLAEYDSINGKWVFKDAWGNNIFYNSLDTEIRNSTLFDIGSPGEDGKWGSVKAITPDKTNFGNGGDDITNTNM